MLGARDGKGWQRSPLRTLHPPKEGGGGCELGSEFKNIPALSLGPPKRKQPNEEEDCKPGSFSFADATVSYTRLHITHKHTAMYWAGSPWREDLDSSLPSRVVESAPKTSCWTVTP